MTEKGGMGQACAACKYQRRKCRPQCPLVSYFPPDKPKQFQNVHKLFGVSNILCLLKQVNDTQKSEAMKSIIYQANVRERDPVYGCFGVIVLLQQQVEKLKEEVGFVKRQIMFAEQQQQYHKYSCMQKTQPVEDDSVSVSVSGMQRTPMPASTEASIYPCVRGYPYQGQQLYRQTDYDVNYFEYEQPNCDPQGST